jgi:hypothetical protein
MFVRGQQITFNENFVTLVTLVFSKFLMFWPWRSIFKGQEISEGNFGIFKFPKKTNEMYFLIQGPLITDGRISNEMLILPTGLW